MYLLNFGNERSFDEKVHVYPQDLTKVKPYSLVRVAYTRTGVATVAHTELVQENHVSIRLG